MSGLRPEDAASRAPSLPGVLRGVLRRLPSGPLARAFAAALNATLRPKLPPALFTDHAGRAVLIEIDDAGLRLGLRLHERGFAACRGAAAPDLRLRASAFDFALLAAREADADTLFFQRRLTVEGDTELAVLVKNALDAVEAPLTRGLLRRLLGLGVDRPG